jgi:hypothetical protein
MFEVQREGEGSRDDAVATCRFWDYRRRIAFISIWGFTFLTFVCALCFAALVWVLLWQVTSKVEPQ